MRALLALARGRGRRPEAPGDLRALRAKPLRFRRAPAIRMTPAGLKRIAPWLAPPPGLAPAGPASQDAGSARLCSCAGGASPPFFHLVSAHTPAAALRVFS